MNYLLDIDFTAKDSGRFQLVYLPSSTQTHYKKVVLYFLPLIHPSETEPRVIKVSYRWKGYFRHLQKFSEELVQFPLKAKDAIGLMEYEVFLEPGTGSQLLCEIKGESAGKQTLDRAQWRSNPGSGTEWQGWRYTVKEGLPGNYAMRLKLERA